MQYRVRESGARLAAYDFQKIGGARGIAARHHRSRDFDRRARCGFEEDGRHRLAHDVGNRARPARGHHSQFAAEIAHHVQVVNQHFGNHQPLHVLRIGLAFDERSAAGLVGQQSGGDRRHPGKHELAQLAGRDPSLQLAVPGPEPPVLVRHEPRLAFHATDERFRLGERRRERLLAQDVDAALGRGIDPGSVGFARRDHVEGVDGFGSEHRIGIAIDVRDRKFSRAVLRPRAIRIADRDEMHALAQVPPADKVIPADHSRAGHRDSERLGFRGLSCHD